MFHLGPWVDVTDFHASSHLKSVIQQASQHTVNLTGYRFVIHIGQHFTGANHIANRPYGAK